MAVSYTHLDVYKRQGLGDGTDGMGNRTGSTGGGEDVLLLIGQAEGLCQMGRHVGCLLYTSQVGDYLFSQAVSS